MRQIAHAVILLWGWRRLATAFAAGALSALAQAPFHLAPILVLTLPVLVWLLDGSVAPGRSGLRRLRPAAAVGWWFGFGYFLAGLWWIGAAFLVEAETFGWMMPFAVLALPAGLALFTALGTALARLMWVESPVRVLSLAVGLGAGEWLRGHLFTGFPWNLFGQAVAFTDVTAQAAAVVGVYGLTVLGLIVFAAPAVLGDETTGRDRWRTGVLGLAAALVVADVGYGLVRLADVVPLAVAQERSIEDGRRVRIVQPAIDQTQKWSPEFRQATLDAYLALSDTATSPETAGVKGVDLLIWPETALPFFLTEEPLALARIDRLLGEGSVLVTGAPRVEPTPSGRRFYNSVYVVDDGGRIVDAYDKAHLVPFGEYLPLQALLESAGLGQLTGVVGGFSEGPGRANVSVPGLPDAGILICYEIIFPGSVVAPGERPGYLVNVTNDAWFGDTPGPYQHLDLARLRAIEEGLPVLRAANTGISAVIDPFGRYVAHLPLGERGVVDASIPSAEATTVFSRMGSYLLLTLYVICAVLIIPGGRKLAWKR